MKAAVVAKKKTVWCCQECGHKEMKWVGVCPACRNWNTFIEDIEIIEGKAKFQASTLELAKATCITKVSQAKEKRLLTGLREFDHLLGGGIVVGSLTLVAGDPGIGKSTLLLQLSESIAKQGLKVLYICGEESIEQTSLRARRLGVNSENLFLLSETNFTQICLQIEQLDPDVLIVDSIQIVYKNELPSAPGSVVQVRELATEFMHLAKGRGITTILIGHVTKSGEIAGPRVLEHIVDVVLDFEGDRQHGYRILRAIKNRFGPVDDIALFQMGMEGLQEVANPSELFLKERMKGGSGSAIVPTIEGSRAILIEIQALAAASAFATSTRRSAGLDQNRLALLLAVLEKRVGYALHHTDVFVSVAGGMKIVEPAIDLGILLAVASSFCNRSIPFDTIVVGEVGLGGEVRSVPRIESRIREAINMGFQKCIIPKRNIKGVSQSLTQKISICGVEIVDEAVSEAFG